MNVLFAVYIFPGTQHRAVAVLLEQAQQPLAAYVCQWAPHLAESCAGSTALLRPDQCLPINNQLPLLCQNLINNFLM